MLTDRNSIAAGAVARRSPEAVMRLARMGSAHPTRLSFLRVLLRQMLSGDWHFDGPLWEVDGKGVGRAVYRATGLRRTYSLVAFAHDLPDDMRSDRVIATAWDALWRWGAETLTLEGQEALLALLIEPHGDLVDDLAVGISADECFCLNDAIPLVRLRAILKDRHGWALATDHADPAAQARFWYVTEEKLEPRLGERATEEGAEREQPFCIDRLAAELDSVLAGRPEAESVAAFLLRHPEHRYRVRGAQIAADHPYAEVQDNLISADMLPIDLMRCKLALFGASHFDPRSDKWVRISLFQGAPYPLDGEACA